MLSLSLLLFLRRDNHEFIYFILWAEGKNGAVRRVVYKMNIEYSNIFCIQQIVNMLYILACCLIYNIIFYYNAYKWLPCDIHSQTPLQYVYKVNISAKKIPNSVMRWLIYCFTWWKTPACITYLFFFDIFQMSPIF